MKKAAFGTLSLSVCGTVYEPAEDSFLLANYASALSGRILDIGTGTGIAALSAASANPKNAVLGVDTNSAAVACAAANAKANRISNCKFLVSDLFAAIPRGEKFDAILFNPPYLPTTDSERLKNAEENAAYDGGKTGLEVFMRFAASAPPYLAPGGKVAVIATSLGGGIEKTARALEKHVGAARTVSQEPFFFEKIALLEATARTL